MAVPSTNGVNGNVHHDRHSSTPIFTEVDQVYTNTGQWAEAPVATTKSQTPSAQPDKLFVAYRRSYPLRSEDDSFIWLELRHKRLQELVKALFPTAGSLYTSTPGVDARDVYVKREAFNQLLAEIEDGEFKDKAREFIDYVERQFDYVSRKLQSYPEGTVSWHLLWSLFETGEDVESIHDVTGEIIALTVNSWSYAQESMGRFFVLHCHFYQWAGTTFHKIPITRKVQEFTHTTETHTNYQGFFFTRAFTGASKVLGDGQIVLDVKSFRRCNPTLDHWSRSSWQSSSSSTSQPIESFDEQHLHLLPPTLHGFSLRAKRWGEFLVSHVSPIVWREEAFAGLVIPPSYRRIIRALVTVHSSELKGQIMKDAVEGKGNGLVMALYGKPGTGKTLTAEAVAEHLRRPLYVASAGELGTTPQILEKQLKDILELATLWNAVLLIDEADIFLTKRNVQQLERSALVGIFLRMLEYFSGVLILTTNHIDQFDEAFLSRFAVVLKFDDLDQPSRRVLWEQFIIRSGHDVAVFDLDRLASFKMNGREIKHAVQTAQAVSLVEHEKLGMVHLEEVLSITNRVPHIMPTSDLPFRILIAGGGIAGLATAIALRAPGREIIVLEASKMNKEVGAAISLQPNASKIMAKLGFTDELLKKYGALVDGGFQIYGTDGTRQLQIPSTREGNFGGDRVLYHRVDLHDLLKELATAENPSKGSPAEIRVASRVASCDAEAGTLTLESGETLSGDLIIGADGIHSKVREGVIGKKVDAVPTGLSAYRLIIPKELFPHLPHAYAQMNTKDPWTTMLMGHSRRVIMGPCRNAELLSIVALVPDEHMHEQSQDSWTSEGSMAHLLESFEIFPDWIKQLFALTPSLGLWQLRDLDPLPTWHKGAAIVIGDAAHAMLPTQGQGASQSIEDAEALGAFFADVKGRPSKEQVSAILEEVYQARVERATLIQAYSRQQARPATDGKSLKITLNPGEFNAYNLKYNGAKECRKQQLEKVAA
ncbi:AAA family ATPase [Pseudohyphozyma bogoriensis]|nr:AAA family ATPase [Pseudohyphozyma bogoriensis]